MERGEETQGKSELHTIVLHTTLSEVSSRSRPAGSDADDSVPQCCVICLDELSDLCEAKPCGHRNFDFLCLISWLEQRPSCPLCKADISTVRYQFSGDDESTRSTNYKSYNVPPLPKEKQPGRGGQGSATGAAATFYASHALPRRRRRWSPASTPYITNSSADEALQRRRFVYQHGLYSLHVGTSRATRYTDLTPEMFEADPALVSRAREWIRRELKVFEFLTSSSGGSVGGGGGGSSSTSISTSTSSRSMRRLTSNAEFLLEYIVAVLRTIDLKGSCGQAEEMIQEFLGRDHTRLFLHELRAWLRSPYLSLEAWDRHVQYDESGIAIPRQSSSSRRRMGRGRTPDGRVPRRREGEDDPSDGEKRRADCWRPGRGRYSPYCSLRQDQRHDRGQRRDDRVTYSGSKRGSQLGGARDHPHPGG